jgi:hypothetical protein
MCGFHMRGLVHRGVHRRRVQTCCRGCCGPHARPGTAGASHECQPQQLAAGTVRDNDAGTCQERCLQTTNGRNPCFEKPEHWLQSSDGPNTHLHPPPMYLYRADLPVHSSALGMQGKATAPPCSLLHLLLLLTAAAAPSEVPLPALQPAVLGKDHLRAPLLPAALRCAWHCACSQWLQLLPAHQPHSGGAGPAE